MQTLNVTIRGNCGNSRNCLFCMHLYLFSHELPDASLFGRKKHVNVAIFLGLIFLYISYSLNRGSPKLTIMGIQNVFLETGDNDKVLVRVRMKWNDK